MSKVFWERGVIKSAGMGLDVCVWGWRWVGGGDEECQESLDWQIIIWNESLRSNRLFLQVVNRG